MHVVLDIFVAFIIEQSSEIASSTKAGGNDCISTHTYILRRIVRFFPRVFKDVWMWAVAMKKA